MGGGRGRSSFFSEREKLPPLPRPWAVEPSGPTKARRVGLARESGRTRTHASVSRKRGRGWVSLGHPGAEALRPARDMWRRWQAGSARGRRGGGREVARSPFCCRRGRSGRRSLLRSSAVEPHGRPDAGRATWGGAGAGALRPARGTAPLEKNVASTAEAAVSAAEGDAATGGRALALRRSSHISAHTSTIGGVGRLARTRGQMAACVRAHRVSDVVRSEKKKETSGRAAASGKEGLCLFFSGRITGSPRPLSSLKTKTIQARLRRRSGRREESS